MNIRKAKQSDLSGILEVLKASLGETSSKKTEEVWNYKHSENPFGNSFVLVAEENNEIIGVRAFMRWQWQKGDKTFDAFRAVDTATHPSHQGKGIFKKLTLKALELGKAEGNHFIFNTPNSQSKPGYIKMGWQEVDQIKVSIRPAFNLLYSKRHMNEVNTTEEIDELTLQKFLDLKTTSNKLFTRKTANFLRWRYKDCALQDYLIFEDKDLFVAAYLKQRGKIRELRVSEAIFLDNVQLKRITKVIQSWSKVSKAHIISSSPGVFNSSITGNIGPVLTVKELNLEKNYAQEILSLKSWDYTLGDLELF